MLSIPQQSIAHLWLSQQQRLVRPRQAMSALQTAVTRPTALIAMRSQPHCHSNGCWYVFMVMEVLGNGYGEPAEYAERVWNEFRHSLAPLPPKVRAAFLLRIALGASDDEISAWIGEKPAVCRLYVLQARDVVRCNRFLPGHPGVPP